MRIDPVKETVGPEKESGSFKVKVSAGYRWSVGTVPDWIKIDSGGSGLGSGTASYTVLENTTNDPRSATLTVGDALHQITQARSPAIRVPYHDEFRYTEAPLPGYVADTAAAPAMNRWNWDQQEDQNSDITLSPDGPPGSASMIVKRPSRDERNWATQVYLRHLNLQAGGRYRVSARMKADNPGAVSFGLGQSEAPFKSCGLSKTFQVTNTWAQYEAEFSADGEVCKSLNNRLAVMAGKIQGKLWIADFSLARAQ